MEKHPGGKDILLRAKNEQDITCLFETYHKRHRTPISILSIIIIIIMK
jgi:cytochrome b involved in lipid metabolism